MNTHFPIVPLITSGTIIGLNPQEGFNGDINFTISWLKTSYTYHCDVMEHLPIELKVLILQNFITEPRTQGRLHLTCRSWASACSIVRYPLRNVNVHMLSKNLTIRTSKDNLLQCRFNESDEFFITSWNCLPPLEDGRESVYYRDIHLLLAFNAFRFLHQYRVQRLFLYLSSLEVDITPALRKGGPHMRCHSLGVRHKDAEQLFACAEAIAASEYTLELVEEKFEPPTTYVPAIPNLLRCGGLLELLGCSPGDLLSQLRCSRLVVYETSCRRTSMKEIRRWAEDWMAGVERRCRFVSIQSIKLNEYDVDAFYREYLPKSLRLSIAIETGWPGEVVEGRRWSIPLGMRMTSSGREAAKIILRQQPIQIRKGEYSLEYQVVALSPRHIVKRKKSLADH